MAKNVYFINSLASFSEGGSSSDGWTVRFINPKTNPPTLLYETKVPDGMDAIFEGEKPTYLGYECHWSEDLTNVRRNMTVYAKWSDTLENLTVEITDSAEEMQAAIADGSYKTKYHLGETMLLPMGRFGQMPFTLDSFDTFDAASGKKIAMKFVGAAVLNHGAEYNKTSVKKGNSWSTSYARSYLNNDVYKEVDEAWKPLLVKQAVWSSAYNEETGTFDNNYNDYSEDWITVPSISEANGIAAFWSIGAKLINTFYKDGAVLNRQDLETDELCPWVMRDVYPYDNSDVYDGELIPYHESKRATEKTSVCALWASYPSEYYAILPVIGIGEVADPMMITDTFAQIQQNIENGTWKTKYQEGMYKILPLGTLGHIKLQIDAMAKDNLETQTKGLEKAAITWVTHTALNKRLQWNKDGTVNGGYTNSDIHRFLNTDLKQILAQLPDSPVPYMEPVQKEVSPGDWIDNKVYAYPSYTIWIPSTWEYRTDPTKADYGSRPYYGHHFADKPIYWACTDYKVQVWCRNWEINKLYFDKDTDASSLDDGILIDDGFGGFADDDFGGVATQEDDYLIEPESETDDLGNEYLEDGTPLVTWPEQEEDILANQPPAVPPIIVPSAVDAGEQDYVENHCAYGYGYSTSNNLIRIGSSSKLCVVFGFCQGKAADPATLELERDQAVKVELPSAQNHLLPEDDRVVIPALPEIGIDSFPLLGNVVTEGYREDQEEGIDSAVSAEELIEEKSDEILEEITPEEETEEISEEDTQENAPAELKEDISDIETADDQEDNGVSE